MSILIKDVEMPVSCAGCPCANDESRYCYAAKKYIPMLGKPDFCPLAEVEERKTGEWTPCSETIDIPDYEVLACDKYGEYIIGLLAYEDDQWLCESEETMMYDPIAWMPLPEPMEMNGNDEKI